MGTMCTGKSNSLIRTIMLWMCLLWALGCRETTTDQTKVVFVKDEEINTSNFKELHGDEGSGFIIKFANVWDDYDDKGNETTTGMIKIPIYGGMKGDVKLSQLRRKRKYSNASILDALVIETGQGKVKKGILDCLRFYQKSLLKKVDITKPTFAGAEMSGLFIWYDFDYEGYPGTIMIGVAADPNCARGKFECNYTDINDIEVNEQAIGFGLSISLNYKSWWREELEKEGKWPRK